MPLTSWEKGQTPGPCRRQGRIKRQISNLKKVFWVRFEVWDLEFKKQRPSGRIAVDSINVALKLAVASEKQPRFQTCRGARTVRYW